MLVSNSFKIIIMKTKLRLLVFGCLSAMLLFSSCEDWLDIQPKSEVSSDKLFETPDGYRTALNGVYLNMSGSDLYGRNLSWGFLETIAQTTEVNGAIYKSMQKYKYDDTNVKGYISSIWSKAYNSIANINNLIANLEEKEESFFNENEKKLMLGELYALRGMMHFDLVRLYAPSLTVGDATAIPYYYNYTSEAPVKLTTSLIIAKSISDVKKGRDLLKDIDTTEDMTNDFRNTEFRFEGSSPLTSINNRGYHMNYYSATALLARMNMYAGNQSEAYDNAKSLIDAEIFEFTSENDITGSINTRNRKLSDDVIFALFNVNLIKYFQKENSDGSEYCLPYGTGNIFAKDQDDFRLVYMVENINYCYYNLKLLPTTDAEAKKKYENMIPMIRLSEMYYIASEYLYNTGEKDKAIVLLNTLRLKRGCKREISTTIDKDEFIEELIMEARKEFLSEGQLWFMYKRLNHEIYDAYNNTIEVEKEFTFDIPVNESNVGR